MGAVISLVIKYETNAVPLLDIYNRGSSIEGGQLKSILAYDPCERMSECQDHVSSISQLLMCFEEETGSKLPAEIWEKLDIVLAEF